MEASAEKRSEYLEKVSKYDKEQMVYLDESSIDRTICQDRGWGKIGELLVGQKSGKQYQRTNIIVGLVNNKPIAPFVFNGTCNTELFNNWVEKFLIKELKAGQVVVLDNASFHVFYYISIDKATGYIYIKSFLWYSDAKIEEGKQQELELIASHLTATEEENIMRTIAEKYIDEGMARYEQAYKAKLVYGLEKRVKELGFTLIDKSA